MWTKCSRNIPISGLIRDKKNCLVLFDTKIDIIKTGFHAVFVRRDVTEKKIDSELRNDLASTLDRCKRSRKGGFRNDCDIRWDLSHVSWRKEKLYISRLTRHVPQKRNFTFPRKYMLIVYSLYINSCLTRQVSDVIDRCVVTLKKIKSFSWDTHGSLLILITASIFIDKASSAHANTTFSVSIVNSPRT